MVNYRHCWGEDRVFYIGDGERSCCLPARWTSVIADDPFVEMSAGRSFFRVVDLLEMVDLVQGVSG